MYSRIAKIKWRMCIYCLYPLLGCPIPHELSYRMHFKWPFHISALLLSWSYGKVLPGSRTHIAHIRKDSHTCTICRIHFITKSSSCSRRFGIACFLSPICTCVPIQKLKGGGVALPRGPSITWVNSASIQLISCPNLAYPAHIPLISSLYPAYFAHILTKSYLYAAYILLVLLISWVNPAYMLPMSCLFCLCPS